MDALFLCLIAWCSISDLRKRIVSNYSVLLLLCLGFVHLGFILINVDIWWQYPTGLLLSFPFFFAWQRNGIGAGDVKLIAAVALYLGLINTIVAFTLMVPILAALLLRSRLTHRPIKNRIPLAPVIGIGATGVLALGYLLQLINH
jgi:Flp pilus assembly protein protease CpaA